MEHTMGLQPHNIAVWDARHLPTVRSLVTFSLWKHLFVSATTNWNNVHLLKIGSISNTNL